jgi:GNAT superfamily N-acetyltransferase
VPRPAFFRITDVGSEEFSRSLDIYREGIPLGERQPDGIITRRVEKGTVGMFAGSLAGRVVLMGVLWPIEGTSFVLLDYLAVKKEMRGRGLGTMFLKNALELNNTPEKHLLMEIEDPMVGDDREQRARRISFYRRSGARTMSGVRYILPPLGSGPTQMVLMVMPAVQSLPGSEVKLAIRSIYKGLYGRMGDDPLLNSFIDAVPRTVELV